MLHAPTLDSGFTVSVEGELVRYTPEGHNPAGRGQAVMLDEWPAGLEAQFFVGLAVRGRAKWKPPQIRDYIMKFRQKQLLKAARAAGLSQSDMDKIDYGGSVTPLLGFWSAISARGPERSVAATIIHVPSPIEDEDAFKANAKILAVALAEKFDQDTVILRMARAGAIIGMSQTAWKKGST